MGELTFLDEALLAALFQSEVRQRVGGGEDEREGKEEEDDDKKTRWSHGSAALMPDACASARAVDVVWRSRVDSDESVVVRRVLAASPCSSHLVSIWGTQPSRALDAHEAQQLLTRPHTPTPPACGPLSATAHTATHTTQHASSRHTRHTLIVLHTSPLITSLGVSRTQRRSCCAHYPSSAAPLSPRRPPHPLSTALQ